MDGLWSNEQENASKSDLLGIQTSDVLELENNLVSETYVEGTSGDKKEDEYWKKLDELGGRDELEFFETMTDKCDSFDSVGISSEIFERNLKLDAVMKNPPKVNILSSEDENLEVPLEASRTNVMVNTRALPKDARTYELEKFQKNGLFIFNQESIDGYEPRLGTSQDVAVLTETFKNFGFHVVEHKDFTKDKIIEVLETFKTTNFSDYGCVGVVVLTHGSFNGMLRAKDQAYSETEILKYFRVYDKPTLTTKPKLLIIQACRGTKCMPAIQAQGVGFLRKDVDEELEPYTLPAMSDMLIVHSSYTGEVSTRDEIHGSWFIQTLCSKINEMASSHDLESILTEVKREVAANRQWEDYNRAIRAMDIYKQMPTVTSTLIRKLYLRKFNDDSPPMTFLDTSKPRISVDPVLDTALSPMLYQLGPCSCFLDHFDYIKKCLTYFVEENPNDTVARTFLDISNAFENENQFNAAKERMAKAICKHLNYNARHCDFFKYLYFYKH